jgi:hypothetical protein
VYVVSAPQPLSAHQHILLQQETEHFVKRYLPSMNEAEHDRIVDSAVSGGVTQLPGLRWMIALTLISLLLFPVTSFAFFKYLRLSAVLGVSRRRLVLISVAPVGLGVMTVCLIWISVHRIAAQYADVDVAGAFVADRRIVLARGNQHLIQSDALLRCVLDHELTHLFGSQGYRKINRDVWLSYAYPAVMALGRGGMPELEKEIFGRTRDPMSMFTEGVIDAGETRLEGDAEAELSKRLLQPINPDAASDGPEEKAMEANRVYDFGLAGIAWYLSGGDSDLALSYLDMRGSGLSPNAARARIQAIINSRGFNYQIRIESRRSDIFNAAELYRIHSEGKRSN